MKVVVAPDSFKGSTTAIEAALAISKGIWKADPEAEIIQKPMADGGEGTLQSLVKATGGHFCWTQTHDPLGREIRAAYGVMGDGKSVIIELAAASGIELLTANELNPFHTTTFGTGELIADAIKNGYRNFVICLGGSATNDGGTGLLKALGFRFLKSNGEEIGPGGYPLRELSAIDQGKVHPAVFESKFQVACDVTNPLIGEKGASRVFGSQKGASLEQTEELDRSLNVFAEVLAKTTGIEVDTMEGAGAAGGTAAGLVGLVKASLSPGVQLVLEKMKWKEMLESNKIDFIVTGEGRLDSQTASGKVVSGVAEWGQFNKIPVFALAGSIDGDLTELYQKGLSAAFSIARGPMVLQESMDAAEQLLETAAENIARLWKAAEFAKPKIGR
jgi:glycerate kinase